LSSSWADGLPVVLALVFSGSALEKAARVWHRSAAWHPVAVAHPFVRAHASMLFAASAAADATVIILVIALPGIAGAFALVLTLLYTRFGVSVPFANGEGCRCMGQILEARTRRGLLARNALLASVGLLQLVASARLAGKGVLPGVVILGGIWIATRFFDASSRQRAGQRVRKGRGLGYVQ
jgi:hypothetical protein